MDEQHLQHYGVKGMKWGKRKIRDTIAKSKAKRESKKDQKWEAKNKSKLTELRVGVNHIAQVKGTVKGKSKAEARKLIQEMANLEKNWWIKSVSPSKKKRVEVFVDKNLQVQLKFVDNK